MGSFKSWLEEMRSVYLYEILADVEKDNPRGKMFAKLAKEAQKQADIWAAKSPAQKNKYSPDLRTKIVGILIRLLGPRHIRTILAAMKIRGLSIYTKSLSAHPTPRHLSEMNASEKGKRHHFTERVGNLRAAVFGVNDGLISNASLIMGGAGASADSAVIMISGLAGLLAGAFSMAVGEYVSMRSQREMFEYQIGLEREELSTYPQAEAEELALIYEAKGLSFAEAKNLAEKLIANPEKALDTLAREELGLNPEELGSPWGAAVSSFAAFGIGALVPLLPFFFDPTMLEPLKFSVLLTGAALFCVGSVLSLFTGRNALWGGLRMLGLGIFAGAATYFIGKLFGVSVGS